MITPHTNIQKSTIRKSIINRAISYFIFTTPSPSPNLKYIYIIILDIILVTTIKNITIKVYMASQRRFLIRKEMQRVQRYLEPTIGSLEHLKRYSISLSRTNLILGSFDEFEI